jgi:hypothetical protein
MRTAVGLMSSLLRRDAPVATGTTALFMMDENFLLYKKRALELLDLMKAHAKPWLLDVFSSANAIKKYDIRQFVELGVEWIWLGLESGSPPGRPFAAVERAP